MKDTLTLAKKEWKANWPLTSTFDGSSLLIDMPACRRIFFGIQRFAASFVRILLQAAGNVIDSEIRLIRIILNHRNQSTRGTLERKSGKTTISSLVTHLSPSRCHDDDDGPKATYSYDRLEERWLFEYYSNYLP